MKFLRTQKIVFATVLVASSMCMLNVNATTFVNDTGSYYILYDGATDNNYVKNFTTPVPTSTSTILSYTISNITNGTNPFATDFYHQLRVLGTSSASAVFVTSPSNIVNGNYTFTLNTTRAAQTLIIGPTSMGTNESFVISNILLYTLPSTVDTQQSILNTSQALKGTFALQNAVLSNSLSYDCSVFDEYNVCVSAGARKTAVSASNSPNNTSLPVIGAYRISPTLRVGAHIDQNLSDSNAVSTINLGNKTPLIGLFGVWSQHLDGVGAEVRVAVAYGQKNTTVNRQIVGTSEAGSGSSILNSLGAQITAKYGFAILPKVLISPYAGVRYNQNNMRGYTEISSAAVSAPLAFSALNTNTTTALAGVGVSYRLTPSTTAFASAGVEADTNTSGGIYSATGATGLTSIDFNPNPARTRSAATIGTHYDIAKNQRIDIRGIYRQEPHKPVSTTTVMATYMVGL